MIRPELHYYWWRAQSAAYLVRPNERTLREMGARKASFYARGRVPPGALSMHVRRGDKWVETPVTAEEAYSRWVYSPHPSSVKPRIPQKPAFIPGRINLG